MPGLRREDERERSTGRLPTLEVALLDLDVRVHTTVPARDLCHLSVRFDTQHGDAAGGEHNRRLPGSGPHLKDRLAGVKPSQLNEIIDQLVRIRRAMLVVEISDLAEYQAPFPHRVSEATGRS
jgi:hypothetical protein